ncbi:Hypothetical predicted protein [Prunus dulcis]|uniref:Uncharacterized protein n=1 Tax=Prunus dulcis TaxID=3755 RepID=A0A5E4FL84_PRUDU|nr:Hypothetical predicted protein [Prunus dulcis]
MGLPRLVGPMPCPGSVLLAGGRSRNIVDANLSVLREKIEVIKMRERLEKCCNNKHQQYGWNYAAGYNYKLRRAREVSTFFELMRLVCVTVGATCFTATLCLVLVSLVLVVVVTDVAGCGGINVAVAAGCRRDVVAGVINGEDYLGLAVRHLGSFIIAAASTGGSGWVVAAATTVLFKSCAMTC